MIETSSELGAAGDEWARLIKFVQLQERHRVGAEPRTQARKGVAGPHDIFVHAAGQHRQPG